MPIDNNANKQKVFFSFVLTNRIVNTSLHYKKDVQIDSL
jgi:hypothetical protein